jgi:hypothetical protein
MGNGRFTTLIAILCALGAVSPAAQARVTRVVVEDSKAPAFDGRSFGAAGPYEMLSGHVFGELDPKDSHNTIITDIALAPRNAHGMVEYSATFMLIKPFDMAKANGVMIYQVPNRGGVLFGSPDDSGAVILTSGWQGDIPPRPNVQTISVPVARNADGSPVTGPAIATFANMAAGQHSLPLIGGIGAGTPRPEPASLDTKTAHLTKRLQDGPRIPMAGGDWAFADCTMTAFPGTSDPHRLCLRNGFDPAYLYELTYIAKDPPVLGIGYAATRDINAFFKYAAHDDAGFANPLAGRIKAAIAIGFSQSGNFLRGFTHLGFNQDETGYIVWDGIESNIAGRQLAMNLRFAVPGGAAGVDEPGSEGVLWWGDYDDKTRGLGKGSLLDRCRASNSCPKVFDLFGSSEFWGLRISPGQVGTDAKADIPLPANVRRYYFPGVTHGGGKGGFTTEVDGPAQSITGKCTLPNNPNPSADTTRALTAALIDWVVKGAEPPASRYPTLSAGQLVAPNAAAMSFPKIPGAPSPDGKLNPMLDYDLGPDFNYRDLTGVISVQPPVIKRTLPSLVPKVDADGNEVGGTPSVLLQAPLGTYLGWNVTASGFYKDGGCGFTGGFIPFARSKVARLASGDPRPSLEERYGTHDAYVARVRAAAETLTAERLLLPGDRDRIVKQAAASNVLKP